MMALKMQLHCYRCGGRVDALLHEQTPALVEHTLVLLQDRLDTFVDHKECPK